MTITTDWHIHSHRSYDCRMYIKTPCLRVTEIVQHVGDKGIHEYGLTDHLHTPFNLPDLAASRKDYEESQPESNFHFGIEASCVSEWELNEIASGKHENPIIGVREGGPINGPLALGLTKSDVVSYGIEYVIGSSHWPMYVPLEPESLIRDCHRQNMFLARHPLVTIIGHPWHWGGPEPWLDNFLMIPKSMHDEFAHTVLEHDTVVEINLMMLLDRKHSETFTQQYLEYFGSLKSRGVKLSVASDSHTNNHFDKLDLATASTLLHTVGIRDTDLWTLS